MITLSGAWLLITVLTLLALGMAAGYALASMRARLDVGGRAPAELKEDYDRYQNKVEKHFETTNELLERMTAQYREVYAHMAEGARELCNAPEVRIDDHMRLIALEQMREEEADDDVADDKRPLEALAATGGVVAAAGAVGADAGEAPSAAGDDAEEEPFVALDDEKAYEQASLFEDSVFATDATSEQATAAEASLGEEANDIADHPFGTRAETAEDHERSGFAAAEGSDRDAQDDETTTASKAA